MTKSNDNNNHNDIDKNMSVNSMKKEKSRVGIRDIEHEVE